MQVVLPVAQVVYQFTKTIFMIFVHKSKEVEDKSLVTDNKNIKTAIKSWSASCLTFASYHRTILHNGQ